MSGHADTIRFVLRGQWADTEARNRATHALDALVAENREQAETVQRQADRIAWLEGEVAGWRIKLAECEERHR